MTFLRERHKLQTGPLCIQELAAVPRERCLWLELNSGVQGAVPAHLQQLPWRQALHGLLCESSDLMCLLSTVTSAFGACRVAWTSGLKMSQVSKTHRSQVSLRPRHWPEGDVFPDQHGDLFEDPPAEPAAAGRASNCSFLTLKSRTQTALQAPAALAR